MHRLRHHRCCCHRCRRCGPDCLRCGICSHLPWQRHSAGRPQSHGRTLPCSCDCMALAAAARPTRTTSTAGALRATSASASTLGATTACPAADAARAVLRTSIACTGCGTTAAAATAAGVAAPIASAVGSAATCPGSGIVRGALRATDGLSLAAAIAWPALPVPPQRLAPSEPRPRQRQRALPVPHAPAQRLPPRPQSHVRAPLVPSDGLRAAGPNPPRSPPPWDSRTVLGGPRSHAPAAAPPLLLPPLPACGAPCGPDRLRCGICSHLPWRWHSPRRRRSARDRRRPQLPEPWDLQPPALAAA